MRPVFFYATIDNVRVKTMAAWIDLTLRNRLQVVNVPYSNALLLLGNSEDVAAAIEVIDILDQPNLAGNSSLKITPAFWSAEKLTRQLLQVLKAEGYSVEIGSESDAPIKFIPVEALNTIIVFATSQQNLRHVLDWASELDQPGQTIDTTGVYYLEFQNTNAEALAEIIGGLIGLGVAGEGVESTNEQTASTSQTRIIVVCMNASRDARTDFVRRAGRLQFCIRPLSARLLARWP